MFKLFSRYATLLDDLVPGNTSQCGGEVFKAIRITTDELVIENLAGLLLLSREHGFRDSFQQCHVAVDSHLEKEIGQLRSRTEKPEHVLRMFEACHSNFRQRIDVDQLATVSLCAFERGQHARMICAGILSNHKDGLGSIASYLWSFTPPLKRRGG